MLEGGKGIELTALFVRSELVPRRDGLLEHLGCETDDHGFIRVDTFGTTSAAGVWAAGNVANPRAQVITAAGEGSTAAIAINAELVDEDTPAARHKAVDRDGRTG